MKNKFILIFMLLLFSPIVLNAKEENKEIEVCYNGKLSNPMLWYKDNEEEKSTVINLFKAKTKEKEIDAYCINPGLKAADENNKCLKYQKDTDFENSECSKSTDDKNCALIGAFQDLKNNKLLGDYELVVTTLRLINAGYDNNGKIGDGLWSDGDKKLTSKELYGITAKYVRNNPEYNGSKSEGDSIKEDGLLYSGTQNNDVAKKAFELFRKYAINGEEIFTTKIELVSDTYTFEKDGAGNGQALIKFKTNFESGHTTIKEIKSNLSDEPLTYEGMAELTVKITISKEELDACQNKKVEITFNYEDDRDILGKLDVYKIIKNNPKNYQDFIVFDEEDKEITKEVEVAVSCGEPEATCPLTMIYEVPNDCSEATEGIIEDPAFCNIMKSEASSYKMDTDIKTNYKNYNGEERELCNLYCREKYEFKFFDKQQVIAGRTFRYNVTSPNSTLSEPYKYLVNIVAKRECGSDDIDYITWEEDFKVLNSKIIEAWNNYQKYNAMYEAESSGAKKEAKKTCPGCDEYDCGIPISYDLNGNQISGTGTKDPKPAVASVLKKWVWYDWSNVKYFYTDPETGRVSQRNTDILSSGGSDFKIERVICGCSGGNSQYCEENKGESAKQKRDEFKEKYENYIEYRKTMLRALKECNFLDSGAIENLESDLSGSSSSLTKMKSYNDKKSIAERVEYSYDDPFSDMINIDSENAGSENVELKYCAEDCKCTNCDDSFEPASGTTTTTFDKYWICEEGKGCKKISITIPANKGSYAKVSKEEGEYQSETFVTEIGTGEVIKASDIANKSRYNLMVYNNTEDSKFLFPVTLNQKNKTAWTKLEIFGIGTDFRKKISKIKDIEYTCSVDICNETVLYENACPGEPSPDPPPPIPDPNDCNPLLYCCPGQTWENNSDHCPKPPDDITLGFIFRPIKMNDVFPNTRRMGRNWANSISIINAIENLSDNFWSSVTPQYSVTITPSNIRNIKNYNLKTNYLNFNNILCAINDGGYADTKQCYSSFLQTMIENEYATQFSKPEGYNDQDKAANYYVWGWKK